MPVGTPSRDRLRCFHAWEGPNQFTKTVFILGFVQMLINLLIFGRLFSFSCSSSLLPYSPSFLYPSVPFFFFVFSSLSPVIFPLIFSPSSSGLCLLFLLILSLERFSFRFTFSSPVFVFLPSHFSLSISLHFPFILFLTLLLTSFLFMLPY